MEALFGSPSEEGGFNIGVLNRQPLETQPSSDTLYKKSNEITSQSHSLNHIASEPQNNMDTTGNVVPSPQDLPFDFFDDRDMGFNAFSIGQQDSMNLINQGPPPSHNIEHKPNDTFDMNGTHFDMNGTHLDMNHTQSDNLSSAQQPSEPFSMDDPFKALHGRSPSYMERNVDSIHGSFNTNEDQLNGSQLTTGQYFEEITTLTSSMNDKYDLDEESMSATSHDSSADNETLLESHVLSSPTAKSELDASSGLENSTNELAPGPEKTDEQLHEISLDDDNFEVQEDESSGGINILGMFSKIKRSFIGGNDEKDHGIKNGSHLSESEDDEASLTQFAEVQGDIPFFDTSQHNILHPISPSPLQQLPELKSNTLTESHISLDGSFERLTYPSRDRFRKGRTKQGRNKAPSTEPLSPQMAPGGTQSAPMEVSQQTTDVKPVEDESLQSTLTTSFEEKQLSSDPILSDLSASESSMPVNIVPEPLSMAETPLDLKNHAESEDRMEHHTVYSTSSSPGEFRKPRPFETPSDSTSHEHISKSVSYDTLRNTDGIDVKYRNRIKVLESQLKKEKDETARLQKKIYNMLNEKSDAVYESEIKSLSIKVSSLERQLIDAQNLSKKWKQQYEEKSLAMENLQDDNKTLKQNLESLSAKPSVTKADSSNNQRFEELKQRYEEEKLALREKYQNELEREKKILENDKSHIQKLISQIKEESQRNILALQSQIVSQNGIIERLMNENSELLENNKVTRRIMMESKIPGSTGSLVKENNLLQKMLDDAQQVTTMLEKENSLLKIRLSILEGDAKKEAETVNVENADLRVGDQNIPDWSIYTKNFTPMPSASNTPVPTPSRYLFDQNPSLNLYQQQGNSDKLSNLDIFQKKPEVSTINSGDVLPINQTQSHEEVKEEVKQPVLGQNTEQQNKMDNTKLETSQTIDVLEKPQDYNENQEEDEQQQRRGWVSGIWSAITFQR